jgi:hypothetical protein
MEDALHEINEILERKDISDKHKAMIMGENTKGFYNLSCKILRCTKDASGVIKKTGQAVK